LFHVKRIKNEKKSKFLLITLREINGEYEYYHKSVHKLPTTIKRFSENHLKHFYGGKAVKYKDGYLFHNEEVFVEIYSYQTIDQNEFGVLKRYL